MNEDRTYICIDLKSFYASVECVERGLDPMQADLVVADPSRTEKTICLAVSADMKAQGVPGRCRLYEIPQGIKYIIAPPRMQLYIQYSAEIYDIYLSFFSKDDIHVYSIDEVFIDVTAYLPTYGISPRQLACRIMDEIRRKLGLYSSCGIGTNLYLAKIALDITAKRSADRIGMLTEESYRDELWLHKPLTDFWRVGQGTAARLARYGITTMRDIALADEKLLYREFGKDAALLIDHANGKESTTISDIKSFRPQSSSMSSGQVLKRGYEKAEARLLVAEMTEALVLDMVECGFTAKSAGIYLSCTSEQERGTVSFGRGESSSKRICAYTSELYDRIHDANQLIFKINICLDGIAKDESIQTDMFSDAEGDAKEHRLQLAMIDIKRKYGKNGILKCADLCENATIMERNEQIGGHRA